jgi:CHASE1-domain containing sensor protein
MPVAGLTKAVDERFYPSQANGGGLLRREIWVDGQGRVIRYNLAYINPLIHAGDNGRVLGYDSAHGQHHRHYRGSVTAVRLDNFEQIEERFQKEWSALAKEAKHAKH